jgi:hypothetical protein
MKEGNREIIQEVLDEIELSLKDPRGLIFHQRRLIFLISIASVALLENYLEKLEVLKKGYKINHLWFKKKKENVKKLMSLIISCPIGEVEKIDEILDIIYGIEKDRNELAYGKTASEETLKEKINLFLELKKEIENENS